MRPGREARLVVQATLVARRAVCTASSFTVAARLSAKLTAAVSRPSNPGGNGCEERAVARVAAPDVLRFQREGHGRAAAARERSARGGAGCEEAASHESEETGAFEGVAHAATVVEAADRAVPELSNRPLHAEPSPL